MYPLPVVVNPVKDAACAVKDAAERVVHKVKEVTASQLLDLPEFIVVGYSVEQRGEEEILHLYCERLFY